MRLLNATTLRLETFAPDEIPRYAILSHRWTDDEVSFQEIHTKAGQQKGAYAKIQGCCKVALGDGLSHIWIDTCCIDQSSSAELSEAINSMFQWYGKAEVCYAYLQDAAGAWDFDESEWFDRGWTLQELVAPANVQFYTTDWSYFGAKTMLSDRISARTGIDSRYLRGDSLELASIAERMSWAAKRSTTRPEDAAYCLLGIFDIHMPLIYGEGLQKAFVRLQGQLIKEAAELSWLAWDFHNQTLEPGCLPGVFAPSPACFISCSDVTVYDADPNVIPIKETNGGLELELPVVRRQGIQGLPDLALIDCRRRHDVSNVIAIPIIKHGTQYYRDGGPIKAVPEERWYGTKKSTVVLSPRRGKMHSRKAESNRFLLAFNSGDFLITHVSPVVRDVHSSEDYRLVHYGPSEGAGVKFARRVRLSVPNSSTTPDDVIIRLWYDVVDGMVVPAYDIKRVDEGTPPHDVDRDFQQRLVLKGAGRRIDVRLVKRPVVGRLECVVELKVQNLPPIEQLMLLVGTNKPLVLVLSFLTVLLILAVYGVIKLSIFMEGLSERLVALAMKHVYALAMKHVYALAMNHVYALAMKHV